MKKKNDIFGVTPEIGDIIVYNPAKHKGLIFGKCVGFSKHGLPEIDIDDYESNYGQRNSSGNYTPKTGFVVKKPF